MSRGFSLIEMLIAVALIAFMATISLPVLSSAVTYYRADESLDTALMQLRLARSMAVDQRRTFQVALGSEDRTITLTRLDDNTQISSVGIHPEVSFAFGAGVATSGKKAPDGLDADSPVDLMNGTAVRFRPDGSAVTPEGEFCNGVVHMAVTHDRKVARAVSVFGATGKIKGWRWTSSGSGAGHWQ